MVNYLADVFEHQNTLNFNIFHVENTIDYQDVSNVMKTRGLSYELSDSKINIGIFFRKK